MKAVLPKHLTDLEAIELIHGPPPTILDAENLRPYQDWMVDAIKDLPGVLLGAEMGLGKTGAVLKAVSDLIATGEAKHVLIIAPLRVSENTWPEEIAKWSFSRHLKYRIVTGTEAERKAALRFGPCKVTIVNRENLGWLLKYIGLRRWPFDTIIYDEVSRLKAGRKRSKPKPRADGTMPAPRLTELGVLDRVRTKTRRFVGLSGTPAPNGLIDLWGPMYAVDKGERLGTSITSYKQRWFIENQYAHTIEPLEHAEDEIMGRIKDRFFALREQDYLDLPPLVEQDHKVKLDPKVMKRYREFEREMAIDLMNNRNEPETIEAVNNGVLTGKLLQFANGSLYSEDGDAVPVHTAKLDALESIVQESAGAPMLVAYSFKFDKDAIRKRFPYVRVFGERDSDMRDWNAGRIRMLMLHPASAGHGLNFQAGSNISVWYGLTWSHELYMQFLKRLHRSGQKRDRVFLHRIIAEGTADELILPVLRNRKATEDRLKEAVMVQLERAAHG